MAARVYNAAEVKQDLYDRITSDGEVMLLMGNITKGDSPVSLWQYNANSNATDNFAKGIIKPALQTGDGRWIRQGNYPISKRQETYSGATNASGNYAVTYPTAYASVPNVQFQINGGLVTQNALLISSTTTGFTVNVKNRTDVIGLLPSYSNVSGATVDVLVTER